MPRHNALYPVVFRRLEKPRLKEPFAKTADSGLRFWNPDKSTPKRRVSFPFEVLSMPPAFQHREPVSSVLCGIVMTTRERSHYLFGTAYRFVVELNLINRQTMGRAARVCTVYGKELFADRKTAFRRGGTASISLYEQLMHEGLQYLKAERSILRELRQGSPDERR